MEKEQFVGGKIEDPRQRLLNRVAACLIKEPNFYVGADVKVTQITADLNEVLEVDPEFLPQLAYYTRETMNLRSISNFILAFAAIDERSRAFLSNYFCESIRLPTDLAEVIEFVQALLQKGDSPAGDHIIVPAVLQRLIRKKFTDFNVYQLGKYCSEGKRKRALKKSAAKRKDVVEKFGNTEQKVVDKSNKGKISMKQIARLCHVCEPASAVMPLLGKRYPADLESFQKSRLSAEGEFDPEMANKRMKIPTPVTWETTLSEKGNCADNWEDLIRSRKLPFMAMLRNLRNMLITGVDPEVHQMCIQRLTDPGMIANSRLFPFRFFTAFQAIQVDLHELGRLHDDPSYVPEKKPEGRRGLKKPAGPKGNKPPKIIRPKHLPTQELLDQYKDALNTAVKIATAENVKPISGHSVIFCDISGSMGTRMSGQSITGSITNCMQVAVLLGLMLKSVCESVEFLVFSSPRNGKCYLPVEELEGDRILEDMATVLGYQNKLGGGTDFPYDYIHTMINERKHVDNMFIFSDMMISPSDGNMQHTMSGGSDTVGSILENYRTNVNENMMFVTVDLAGHGRSVLGAELEDNCKNVLISGYSDAILRLVSELQNNQVDAVKETAQNMLSKKA